MHLSAVRSVGTPATSTACRRSSATPCLAGQPGQHLPRSAIGNGPSASTRPSSRACGTSARRPTATRAAPEQAAPQQAPVNKSASGALLYDHLLVAILDANPYLSEGSKQAVATAAQLTKLHQSRLTVLIVDEAEDKGDPKLRMENITWHLRDQGLENFEFVEKSVESKSSVIVGDVADEIEADLLILSSEAVHGHHVDANLLAEFVPCPVLLLP